MMNQIYNYLLKGSRGGLLGSIPATHANEPTQVWIPETAWGETIHLPTVRVVNAYPDDDPRRWYEENRTPYRNNTNAL